jgi:pyridoxal phosphate enzyme (YggS family)
MFQEREQIRRNVEEIRRRIARAAEKSGRRPEEIKLVAVTKTVEPLRIIEAIDAGVADLGENRVQELCEKYSLVDRQCQWHLIGHLQTNKVKYIIDKVKMIHSVDSEELAREIQKRAEKAGRHIDILVQVNIAKEESKFGIDKEEAEDFIRSLSKYNNLKVKGLMTIAPFTDNRDEIRHVFRELRKVFIDISRKNIDNIDMESLSMGMSNDFEIAIEEGSTIVRIGTSIFGRR